MKQPIIPRDLYAGVSMDLDRRKTLDLADRWPEAWRDLKQFEKELLGGAVDHVAEVHGPVRDRHRHLVARLQEVVRACWDRTMERGGYGHDLRVYFEPDEERRARWRHLDLTLQRMGNSLYFLSDLFESLMVAGDLEQSLLQRRAAIDGHLARLRARRPVPPGKSTAA